MGMHISINDEWEDDTNGEYEFVGSPQDDCSYIDDAWSEPKIARNPTLELEACGWHLEWCCKISGLPMPDTGKRPSLLIPQPWSGLIVRNWHHGVNEFRGIDI